MKEEHKMDEDRRRRQLRGVRFKQQQKSSRVFSFLLLCCLWQMFKKCVVSVRHAVMEFKGKREIIWSFVCLLNHDRCVVVVCNRNLLISFGFDCDLIALPWRFFFTQLAHIIKLFWSYTKRLCAECWTWRTSFLCSLENYNWEFDPVVMLSRVIYTQQRDEKWEEENKISASFQFPTRWFCDIFALYMWLCCACLPAMLPNFEKSTFFLLCLNMNISTQYNNISNLASWRQLFPALFSEKTSNTKFLRLWASLLWHRKWMSSTMTTDEKKFAKKQNSCFVECTMNVLEKWIISLIRQAFGGQNSCKEELSTAAQHALDALEWIHFTQFRVRTMILVLYGEMKSSPVEKSE